MKLQWFSVTIPLAYHRGVLQLHTEVSGTAPEDAFGSFRVLHQVGAGVLGPVFRAYDPERDRLVAVKLFRLDLPPERVHRLVAGLETLVAADLTHPSIAAPIEAGIVGANAYLVQEYVAADSLDISVRDEGPVPVSDALRIAAQIASGLDFAAVAGVGHGSLHPRDVMLSPDRTRLTGLGIARAVEQAGGGVSMRRPYTAPERVAGSSWDRRADVFSFAAVMHEVLWARRITATGDQAADALVELPGGDLDRLRAVFACALAEDPAGRYETALEFAQALKSAFPHVAIAPIPSGPAADVGGPTSEPSPVHARGHAEPADLPFEEPSDLDLRALDSATEPPGDPAGAALLPSIPEPEAPAPPQEAAPFAAFAYEQSRSAVWPLVLALVVGVALGFAGGYGVGVHDRPNATLPDLSTAALGGHGVPGGAPDGALSGVATPAGQPQALALAGSATAASSTAAGRSAPAPIHAEPVQAGRPASLRVRTTPAGAQVFVDGRDYGRAPLLVRDLARGAHRVRVVHDGFGAKERRVILSGAREPQLVAVTLLPIALPPALPRGLSPGGAPVSSRGSPKAQPTLSKSAAVGAGGLSVESRPAGARVFVDNRLAGTTPLSIADLPAGEHSIRIELDGYRRWSASTRVTPGEHGHVGASLEK